MLYMNRYDQNCDMKFRAPERCARRQQMNKYRMARFFVFSLVSVCLIFSCVVVLHATALDQPEGVLSDGTFPQGEMTAAIDNENESQVEKLERKKIIVRSGDTLWQIASHHAPEKVDIRTYIAHIKKLNQLDSSMLYVDQLLVLP